MVFEGDAASVSLLEATFAGSEKVVLHGGTDPAVAISRSGVIAFPGEESGTGHRIVSAESVSLFVPGLQITGIATVGRLSWHVLSWKQEALPTLHRFLVTWLATRKQRAPLATMAKSSLPCDLVAAIDLAMAKQLPITDFCLLACVLNVVPALTKTSNRVMITPVLRDLPEQLQLLVNDVLASPAKSWSLTEASNQAGYSSFHFSRMFKQLVGCGFHEFVDRCRTEVAVVLLSDPQADAHAVWALAGFPSVRAMRESIRDYLGLTVNDLRRLADLS